MKIKRNEFNYLEQQFMLNYKKRKKQYSIDKWKKVCGFLRLQNYEFSIEVSV